jgi:hypothetical protein
MQTSHDLAHADVDLRGVEIFFENSDDHDLPERQRKSA